MFEPPFCGSEKSRKTSTKFPCGKFQTVHRRASAGAQGEHLALPPSPPPIPKCVSANAVLSRQDMIVGASTLLFPNPGSCESGNGDPSSLEPCSSRGTLASVLALRDRHNSQETLLHAENDWTTGCRTIETNGGSSAAYLARTVLYFIQ